MFMLLACLRYFSFGNKNINFLGQSQNRCTAKSLHVCLLLFSSTATTLGQTTIIFCLHLHRSLLNVSLCFYSIICLKCSSHSSQNTFFNNINHIMIPLPCLKSSYDFPLSQNQIQISCRLFLVQFILFDLISNYSLLSAYQASATHQKL